jgi:C1A family cysteine protease
MMVIIFFALDWTTANPPVVTPVKNQGECGSCWAFAAAATLEGYYARKTNKPVISLSEEQFIDCSTQYCYACNGGDPWSGKYIVYI